MNIHVKELATEARESMEFTDNWTNTPNEVWQIRLRGEKLFHLDKQIQEYIAATPIWHKQKCIDQSEFYKLALNSMNKEMKNSTIQTRHWTVKREAGIVEFQRKQKDRCPFCGHTEMVKHVYKCQDIKVLDGWEQCIWLLEKEMTEYQTDIIKIIEQLCSGLRSRQSENIMEDG
jgi:hypothetical protein